MEKSATSVWSDLGRNSKFPSALPIAADVVASYSMAGSVLDRHRAMGA
ncbi:hypothetical protein GA0070624_5113 [Micromonospora rhizosphaerae]|uniref:Uncharacterized protein n=1 Tax=Micromonospora rhizosphaerae TaxID=568872 RepID=A0A1C6SZE2_9ACTN|nr:hypothetical protein [Micromonospora rhizosphaerae]SCL34897.1 hypothetical protein GA0070624_5113 [Micromonospora rhizosphaerae]